MQIYIGLQIQTQQFKWNHCKKWERTWKFEGKKHNNYMKKSMTLKQKSAQKVKYPLKCDFCENTIDSGK